MNGRTKAKLRVLAVWLGVAALLFLGVRSCGQRLWEEALHGPFPGEIYDGAVPAAPVSVLALGSHGQLEVHELPQASHPVLLLRSSQGAIQWARVLAPEMKQNDGSIDQPAVRDLRLMKWRKRGGEPVIWITCDWEWGGKEGGLIYLDAGYGFKAFSLSW